MVYVPMHVSTPTRPSHQRGSSTGYFPPVPASSSSTPHGSPAPGSRSAAVAAAGPPVTRSRTLYFLSIRDTSGGGKKYRRRGDGYGELAPGGEDEREGLMGGEGGAEGRKGSVVLDMGEGTGAGLPPKWVDITDEISDIMARARTKVSALEKLHAKHVLPGFNDRSREEREIEAQTADITRDLRRLHKLLTAIRPASSQRNEIITAQNVQRGLAAKVQDLSAEFRKKQRVYMNKLQGHAVKNKDLMVSSGAVTLKGKERIDELEEDLQASSKQISSTQTDTYASNAQSSLDSTIQQRDHELTEIAKSITELADLFRDLGNLVVEQGTVLDCVEYNVTETARDVKGAVEELKVATRYQKRAGRRKCICFLLLLVIGLIIILVYRPRKHPSLPNRPIVEPADRPSRPGAAPVPAQGHTVHRSRTFVRPPSLPTARPQKARPPVVPAAEEPGRRAGWRPRGRRRWSDEE